MKCHINKIMLMKYIEQELDADDSRYFRNHLSYCKQCNNELKELNNLSYKLSKLPELYPSKELHSVIIKKIEQINKKRSRAFMRWQRVQPNLMVFLKFAIIALILFISISSISPFLVDYSYNDRVFDSNEPADIPTATVKKNISESTEYYYSTDSDVQNKRFFSNENLKYLGFVTAIFITVTILLLLLKHYRDRC